MIVPHGESGGALLERREHRSGKGVYSEGEEDEDERNRSGAQQKQKRTGYAVSP